jgi:hypothetical protein
MRRFEKDKDIYYHNDNHCNRQSAANTHGNMCPVQRLDEVRSIKRSETSTNADI